MATNLEWLYENDREALINIIEGDCDKCKFYDTCEKLGLEVMCTREWLEEEYEEADSWEKIERDARQGMDYYYVNILCNGMRNIASVADIHRYIVEDIINRCKAVAGVE